MSRELEDVKEKTDKTNKTKDQPEQPKKRGVARRNFLRGAAALGAATAFVGLEPIVINSKSTRLSATDIGPQDGPTRKAAAYETREESATFERDVPIPAHPDNGDEARYSNDHYYGSFTKGLRQNTIGLVDPLAYQDLLKAVEIGTFAAFENLRKDFGCIDTAGNVTNDARRMVNPLSGYAYDLEGTDSHQVDWLTPDPTASSVPIGFPPAPTFNSQQEAAEIVELY